HNRPCRDEGAHSGDGQCTDTRQPSQGSADHRSGGCAGCSSFGSFCVFLDGKIFCAFVFGKQHRDVGIAKAFRAKKIDCVLNVGLSLIDSKCCCILSGHKHSSDDDFVSSRLYPALRWRGFSWGWPTEQEIRQEYELTIPTPWRPMLFAIPSRWNDPGCSL